MCSGDADDEKVPVNLKERDAFHLTIEEYLLSLVSLIEDLVPLPTTLIMEHETLILRRPA